MGRLKEQWYDGWWCQKKLKLQRTLWQILLYLFIVSRIYFYQNTGFSPALEVIEKYRTIENGFKGIVNILLNYEWKKLSL